MREFFESLKTYPLLDLVGPPLMGLAVFIASLLLRRILLCRLTLWAQKTRWVWDDLLVESIRGPFILWCLIISVYISFLISPMSAHVVDFAVKALTILWIISLTMVVLRVADQIIHRYSNRLSVAVPLTSLTQNLAKGIILVVGGLVVLNSMGISITPILTALGVGGLAVALALQDTLGNLFSGFYVTVARHVRVGDYIKLDTGQEGFVLDIAWRTTRIRSPSNNLIVVPNTKIAQAIITNYNLPSMDSAITLEMGVAYGSDLEKVDRVTCAVAKEVMHEVPGGIPTFEPLIRYHTVGPSSVNFTVILQVRTYDDQPLIKHEFIKRVLRRYAAEEILIPFPMQTIFLGNSSGSSEVR